MNASALQLRTPAPSPPPASSSTNGFDLRCPEIAFSPLEWAVVAVARGDRIVSVRPMGAISLLLGWIFGIDGGQTLADPKLEALRRISVLAWHRLTATSAEMSAFARAGYREGHVDLLYRTVERAAARHDPDAEHLAASRMASVH